MKTTTDQSLFEQGYRCELSADGAALVVITPEEKRYRVNLIGQTCSCPAGFHGAPCKHLREARILALAQVDQLWHQANLLAIEAETRYSIYRLHGGKQGWTRRGEKMLIEATRLKDQATALYEWAHQEVRTVQATRIAA